MAIWEQLPWPASSGDFSATGFREHQKCVAPVSDAQEISFSLWQDIVFWLLIAFIVAFLAVITNSLRLSEYVG